VRANKKPTTVASRGFLLKIALRATSPNGVADYDDNRYWDLQRYWLHAAHKLGEPCS
jgi:hypothetical protein